MDKRIHYYLILDVETANTLEQPFVYDIGGVVADRYGRIYESFSYVISDIYLYERDLMRSAYYAEKIPEYAADLRANVRQLVSFYDARMNILALMNRYNITDIAAYNAHFDVNALNITQRWLTKSKYRYFFPFGTNVLCIWNMACQTICTQKSYRAFCEQNKLFSNRGNNYSTSAENVYKYLLNDSEYKEEHKGYDDVLIESAIMRTAFAQHKRFPYGKGVRRNCWQDIKREV